MSKRRVVREGYLTKSPPPDKLMAKWQERFFVLWSTQVMEYYTSKDKRAQNYRKSIDLGHCTDLTAPFRVGSRDFVIKVTQNRPKDGCRDYMFDCGSQGNMEAWLEALSSVCSHVTSSEGGRKEGGPSRLSYHAPDRALPEVPTTPEPTSSSEDEDGQHYDECEPSSVPSRSPEDSKRRVPMSHLLPRQQRGITPPPEEELVENYEELDDMQAPAVSTQRPPLKLPTRSVPHTNSNGSIPPDTKKRPPMPPPKPQATPCDDQQENYEELDDMQAPAISTQRPPLKLPTRSVPHTNSNGSIPQPGPETRKQQPPASSSPEHENYEEMDDMQAPAVSTQRPPLKLPTRSVPHTNSNGNIPPDTKKRPPMPPPKPQATPCDDQQENYEDMQAPAVSTQRPPLKLPTRSVPHTNSNGSIPQPGPETRKQQPPASSSPEHENYEEMDVVPDPKKRSPMPQPKPQAASWDDQQELHELLNMTLKKPLSNPLLVLALDAAKSSDKKTSKHSPVSLLVHGEEDKLPQSEVYESLDSAPPPVPSRNVAPPPRDGQGSTPSGSKKPRPYEEHVIPQLYEAPQSYEPTTSYPYEEPTTSYPYEEPTTSYPYEEPTTSYPYEEPTTLYPVTYNPLFKHRELKVSENKDFGVGSKVRGQGRQVYNSDDVSSIQKRPPKEKSACPPSPSLPPGEDEPPDVPQRQQSFSQDVEAPPPPPPRTTSIPQEDDEPPKQDEPPALPSRKTPGLVAFEAPSKRDDPPAPPTRKASIEGEQSPNRSGSPLLVSSSARVTRDESTGPPRNVPHPRAKPSSAIEAHSTKDKNKNPLIGAHQKKTLHSDSNLVPPADTDTQTNTSPKAPPTTVDESSKVRSPNKPQVMPKPSLRPSVQTKRPESPLATPVKSVPPQPTPKPRTRQRSPDEGNSIATRS